MKEISDFINAVGTWSPWLVLAAILVFYMRQQGRSDERRNDILAALIKNLGTIQTDSDNTRKEVQELADETRENTEVIQVFAQSQRDFKGSLETVNSTLLTFDKTMHSISDTYVQTTNDHSAGLQAVGERLIGRMDATKVDIINTLPGAVADKLTPRLDNLPGEIMTGFDESLTKIREDLSKFIDPDLASKIANALQPGLVALVERVLVDCLKQNTELAKELDKTEHVDDTATRAAMLSLADGEKNRAIIDGDKPEPPTPGTKAPLPFEKPDEPVLGRTGTEGI